MSRNKHPFVLQIMKLIELRAGLLLHEEHRKADALRAIEAAVKDLALRDEEALNYQLQLYDAQHSTWQTLLKPLTIGETYFFRNQAHFNALRNEVLPQLIAQKRELNERWLRIWSAGCATGEEIYSIAILIRELLPDYKDWSIYLVGTDINEAYLEQARQGLYRINSFRSETPANLRDDWFVKQGSNCYKLDAGIRHMVVFQNLNLVTDLFTIPETSLHQMDLILCQNVTIYFDRQITERIQAKLVEMLAIEGWLILGHSEPLFIKTSSLKLRNFQNAILFQHQAAPIEQNAQPPLELSVSKPQPHITIVKWIAQPVKQILETDKAEDLFKSAQQAADNQLWNEALALLNQLLPIYQLHGYPHYLRALIYMEKSEDHKALTSLRQAIYCNPNFILAHYTLGELYNRMKHTAHAKHEWQLTQNLLAGLPLDSLIPYSADLTVEMLSSLVAMQLNKGDEDQK